MLAVPGTADTAGTAADIAALTRAAHPGVDVRVGHLDGDEARLDAVLAGLGEGERPAGAPAAAVVPLVTGPHPRFDAALRWAIAASGVDATLTEPLGPHPLLAEALHVRLAESGLARADRVRLLSLVTAADGIVTVTTGGAEAVREAGVTAVLLASRLAVAVVPASLDGDPGVGDAAVRLREAGTSRLALAPCLIGPEADLRQLAAAAAEVGAECAEPLGAHPAIVQLVTLRYVAALSDTLGE